MMNTVVDIEPVSLRRARTLANLLDSAFTIPIVRKKVGIDPLLGLIPGLGDAIALGLSIYILWAAYDLGLPRWVMFKMVMNLLIDSSFGAVPVLGDLFDMAWKSNQRNYRLLENAYAVQKALKFTEGRTQRAPIRFKKDRVIDVQNITGT